MILQFSSYLFRAKPEDEKNIRALCAVFQSNHRMRALVGQKKRDISDGIQVIVSFSYFMVKKLGGIFTSKNQSTFLLFYRKSEYYFSIKDVLHYLYLAFFVVGIFRLWKVYEREQIILRTRANMIEKSKDPDYLYVWFLGQKKEQKSLEGLMEAKSFIIQQSKILNLPIYMETTEERLVPIYQRIGFEFYDCREDSKEEMKVWFGRACF